jgi:DNA-binding MurR/RpiR family transcriptional regulator
VNGHGEKRTRKEGLAVLALLTEKTYKEAAEKAGISESTLFRWMQTDSFKQRYDQAKQQVVTHATGRLRQSMTLAVDTLEAVMRDSKAPAMARVIAAKTVIETALKAIETEDLSERIEELEKRSESA